jgi:4-aminobutyrate aminotransferase-like enzyme
MNFSLNPIKTSFIETKNRKICTSIPSPETIDTIKCCLKYEPYSMNNQIPIVWDRAEGFNIYDKSGNKWIDFTSTIFVANVGHSHPRIKNAIKKMVDQDLLNAYYYPTDIRAEFCKYLINNICNNEFEKVLLLSTGSEANEAAIKMAKIRKKKKNPLSKNVIVSFENAFHGKTLGSQLSGGKNKDKFWIKNEYNNNLHLPFPYPDVLKNNNMNGEEFFNKTIKELLFYNKIEPSDISAFITEPYQGWCAIFLPEDYAKTMSKFCKEHDILLIIDEVQSGFGRTGEIFAYKHFNIHPDIVVCGKAISSSLPLSAVITSDEISSVDESFNSTHGGNPIAVAASLESIKILIEEDLVNQSKIKGEILRKELTKWQNENQQIKSIHGKGLLFSVFIDSPNKNITNNDYVDLLIEEATRRGLMSVRTMSGTLKIGPPLVITEDALIEGIEILKESLIEINKNIK